MVKGTLNAQRNPEVPPTDDRACVFVFIDDPGEGGGAAVPRRHYCSVENCESFMRDELHLPADLVQQLASSLEFGENSTMEVELGDEVYAQYFGSSG